MRERFNPLKEATRTFFGAAEVVGKVAEKTREHTEPIVLYAKDRLKVRLFQAIQRRIAKASYSYRFRMG